MRAVLLIAATVLAGLHAGFFFTWSFTVMNGLDAAPAGTAIEAMQATNANIRNAPFGIVFFGAPVVALIAAGVAMGSGARKTGILAAAGFLGLAASVALTAGIHIPLNEALVAATVPEDAPAAQALWSASTHQDCATASGVIWARWP